nr:MAG TPA: hypothetical protein [Crassvirales sp.]
MIFSLLLIKLKRSLLEHKEQLLIIVVQIEHLL